MGIAHRVGLQVWDLMLNTSPVLAKWIVSSSISPHGAGTDFEKRVLRKRA
jgi:hypothetical protein